LRMARENPGWGCVRISGELLKVGHVVSATAIRNLLRREGIGPAPGRSGLSWKAFLKAQASAIVVSDFFSVDTVFLRRLYVLLYMDLATRRILWFGVTAHPDTAWVTQQSRNLVWKLEGSPIRYLIHDHDAKFAEPSDAVMEAEGIRVIKTPIAAPKANAYMERQIGSGRRECFDWLLILGRRHLEGVLAEWIEHYNTARPHRGLELRTPIARSDPVSPTTEVRCRARLGRPTARLFERACRGAGVIRCADEYVRPTRRGRRRPAQLGVRGDRPRSSTAWTRQPGDPPDEPPAAELPSGLVPRSMGRLELAGNGANSP